MTLEEFGRPSLPVAKKRGEFDEHVAVEMTNQQFGRGRRRAGAGVEKGNVQFAPRERLIQNREISDHDRKKTDPDPGLQDYQCAPCPSPCENVADAQSKECRSTEVQVGEEAVSALIYSYRSVERFVKKSKTKDYTDRPHAQQKHQ